MAIDAGRGFEYLSAARDGWIGLGRLFLRRDPAIEVVARLYYQSFAPYFLDENTKGNGPAALRLAALVRNLDLRGTPLDGWRLLIAEGSAAF